MNSAVFTAVYSVGRKKKKSSENKPVLPAILIFLNSIVSSTVHSKMYSTVYRYVGNIVKGIGRVVFLI